MPRTALTGIVALVALALAPQAWAQGAPGSTLGGSGKRGRSAIGQGSCKYGVSGPVGFLRVAVAPPSVSGANTKRGTRRERTYVRYRVYVTDANRDNATLQVSGWSSSIAVRQSGWRSWAGITTFDMDWRGNYGADIRIEWWNSRRMIGWRAHRLSAFAFYDQYNVGPFGPLSSCYKYTNY